MDAIDYEKAGFIKGVTVKTRVSSSNQQSVILVSNPKLDETDGRIKAWVAMEFDTYIRYLALMDDLELT